MARTNLNIPAYEEVRTLNKLTRDGTGDVRTPDVLRDILACEGGEFDYVLDEGAGDLDDPVKLGMAFAYLIANRHPYVDGNLGKSLPKLPYGKCTVMTSSRIEAAA